MDFTIEKIDASGKARAGVITTSRGPVKTPVFMPVATRAAVRALAMRDIEELGFEMILSNTYHLYIRPGTEILASAGGLHAFMNYRRPILTDSGGYQVFSLSDLCRVRDEGVEFRSHLDGSSHFFSPEKVLDIQKVIGSDIMMVLDECTEYPAGRDRVEKAVRRTVDWATASYNYWRRGFDAGTQGLFAIIQGGVHPELRMECADALTGMDFSGFAIGGLSVGETRAEYRDVTEYTAGLLPHGKPRYMMGVGSPMEILHAVGCGIDMFDCVMPTRIARNGTLFTSRGRVNIKSSAYARDDGPLDPDCGCHVCRSYTKSYLRHIFRAGEISSLIYNTYHNLYFMKGLMDEIRRSIYNDKFPDIYKKWNNHYGGTGN
ncbi:MAG: tRNA guanosine(34) transglycosylase Tgt [Spirochaetes bacterium]|jgi:queuine tRNA-ribosyltransferase|nr:tRNA guanosine(34) transglycosylase Tgt [Spirochaetota bacterium]